MRAETLKQTIKALFPTKRTLCVEGAPGGGKTSIVEQAAKELGVALITCHMPTMLVEDFGIPVPDKASSDLRYWLPHWFPQEGKAPEEGILLFDDRNQAGSDLQKVLANLCQARTLHGTFMPKGWMVIATGNRQEDRAGANKVLSHLRNRETVITLDTDVDDWVNWATSNGVKPEVVSFIKFRPDLLHKFDPQAAQNPTPRSWVDGVSAILGVVPHEAEFDCFKGAVGEGAAVEFAGYMKTWRSLPDIDKCIKSPKTAPVPDDAIVMYAITGAIAQKTTKGNFKNVLEYFSRMPKEFSVLLVKLAIKKDQTIAGSEAFARFCKDNANFIA